MTNLLKAEFFKLNRTKSFWVILGIVTGFSALLHYLIMIDWWVMNNTPFDLAGLGELNALSPFTTLLFFNLIVSPLAGFFISVEFSHNGTIKNEIMSGNKRSEIFLAKFLIYSLSAIIATVLIPLLIGIVFIYLLGDSGGLTSSNFLFLGRAYGLFILQFLCYAVLLTIFAITTEDSGKTIIFSILFTILLFAVEKLPKPIWLKLIYEHSIFYQLSAVFQPTMSSREIFISIMIGVITLIVFLFCGVFIFNRKEIK